MICPDAIFLDIDGTILRSDHSLSKRVMTAIHRLSDTGTLVCLATGRSWEALKPLYDTLELAGPTVCYNGAMIVEGPEGRVAFEQDMNEEVARTVIAEARARMLELVAYRHSVLLYEGVGEEVNRYSRRVAIPGKTVNFDTVNPLEFTKCICVADPESLRPLKELLEDKFSADLLSCTYSDRRFLEIMGGGVDKGRGLLEVCRIHNIDPGRTVAMGDGWNDIDLLKSAGDAWVMGGAPEDMKAHFPADRIAPDSDEDGVAQVIEAMLENRLPDFQRPAAGKNRERV
jgi:Cof subfamily protein (haloacid dehalogenase superfamily)